MFVWVVLGIIVAMMLITSTVKVVPEYERGVVFRLGRLVGPRGPGLFFLIPGIERMIKVSLRTVTFDVTPQEVMTRDNVPIKVNAVVWFRVMDPSKAIVEVENYRLSTMQIAQTTLRGVLGQMELDEILAERDKINHKLQQIIDEQTDPWGIKVSIVEIKEVELPDTMKRAMARQAEVERDRRAKVINAEGEYQASEKLVAAARRLSEVPIAIQLRYLQTASEIATEKNSTLVFPIPIEMFSFLKQSVEKKAEQT
ncbi:MAG TPA: slipin family protein [Candidatus Ratteibacteria bacterium]|nr:slipin family protein [bacterium]HPC29659.1 slipin family protein [bacterium]HRS06955.1 slipin family protein [Candidatus Ratteibacteria bacterium]HRV04328.1 slipin family protein [Candidatus Ratteibacteria bacterium]